MFASRINRIALAQINHHYQKIFASFSVSYPATYEGKIYTSKSLQCEKLTVSYDHGLSSDKLIGKTVGQVINDAAKRFPNHEAIVCHNDDRRITFSQLLEQVDQLAAGFLAIGLERGDRVGVWGQNHMEWVFTLFAAAKAGLIVVNVNPAHRANELEYSINKVGMKALCMMPSFKTSNYYEILREVAPEIEFSQPGKLRAERIPCLHHVIVTEGPALPGTFSLEQIMNFAGGTEQHRINELKDEIQFDQPVNIQFTSGTTGNPKAAVLTHHNIVNNAYFVGFGLQYSETSKVCIPVPLFHCFGMTLGCLSATMFGSTQIYPARGFDPAATLEAIDKERATSIYGTPAMFIDMLHQPNKEQFDFTSLETGVMAGSPCPVEVMNQIVKDLKCDEMTIGYGLTETSPVVNLCPRSSSVERRTSTIGLIMPHMEIKVIDENENITPVNTSGELCYRGHSVFYGYWEDEQKTKDAIDDNGWFHTGDIGTIDEEGYTKVVGRLKDMVIRGGENIYPTEVENFLYKHPKIEDVQIIGVPDKRLGEELCAWIKLKRDVEATSDEIKDFCKGKIAHYKIPKYIEFVEEYPMTISGKIKKFEIRNEMIKRFHDASQTH